MCGIFACLFCGNGINSQLKDELISKLKRRGPDAINEVTLDIRGPSLRLNLIGSLLRMRGDPTPQPHPLSGHYLLWNGNVFGGKIEIPDGCNDTVILGQKLADCEGGVTSPLVTVGTVHGPWAFVYWQDDTQSLWFGRDVFGRRSLLWHTPSEGDAVFTLCSVGQYNQQDMPLGYWREVPANGIYQLKCHGSSLHSGELICYPWMQGDDMFQSECTVLEDLSSLRTSLSTRITVDKGLQVPFPPLNRCTPVEHSHQQQSDITVDLKQDPSVHPPEAFGDVRTISSRQVDWSLLSQQLLDVLQTAVQVRVNNAPPVLSTSTSSEAVNNAPPVLSTSTSSEAVNNAPPVLSTSTSSEAVNSAPPVLSTSTSSKGVASNGSVWSSSMREGQARVAVLYSGGVDSTVLAALTDKCLPQGEEIDLINVAFEQQSAPVESRFAVPDRVTAIDSLKELNPGRTWNLVEVNVTLEEVNEMRSSRVSHMVYPLCTVLDDSIGCALWFAARGVGLLHNHSDTLYHSQARTLFVGIGADEQLAGYSRHRTKFNSSGWSGLTAELDMEIKRLGRRNLGRDDRCVADHQREGQFPFLDETVVAFLQSLPSYHKADLSLPRGQGEKRLLREVAARLDCHGASTLPKRAIQFGSRIAKLCGSSNSREQGSNVTDRLLPGTTDSRLVLL